MKYFRQHQIFFPFLKVWHVYGFRVLENQSRSGIAADIVNNLKTK